jgi:hypothetical protein
VIETGVRRLGIVETGIIYKVIVVVVVIVVVRDIACAVSINIRNEQSRKPQTIEAGQKFAKLERFCVKLFVLSVISRRLVVCEPATK